MGESVIVPVAGTCLKIGLHDVLEMRQKLDSIEINRLPSYFGDYDSEW